jgi:hypothetical protein
LTKDDLIRPPKTSQMSPESGIGRAKKSFFWQGRPAGTPGRLGEAPYHLYEEFCRAPSSMEPALLAAPVFATSGP